MIACKRCDRLTTWECLCLYCGWCVQCVLACGHRDQACTEYNEHVPDAGAEWRGVEDF